MKKFTTPIIALSIAATIVFSCKKNEGAVTESDFTTTAPSMEMVSDSDSYNKERSHLIT